MDRFLSFIPKFVSVLLCVAMLLSPCVYTSAAQVVTPPTDITSTLYHFENIWNQYEEQSENFNWSGSGWVAEYTTAHLSGVWQPMVYSSAPGENVTSSFGHNNTFGSQPCVFTKEDGVVLLANQWGDSTYWYDMAAVSFTCMRDGEYLITCPIIRPFEKDSLTDGHEGRLTLTVNGNKVWPMDKAYASVTQDYQPTFEDMTLTLKKGDIIRFEGYGGMVGHAGRENDSYWKNYIYLTPAVQLICAEVESLSSGNLIETGEQNLILGELPITSFYLQGKKTNELTYQWNDLGHLTDEKVDTAGQTNFLSTNKYDYQTLTYEISDEATIQKIQLIFDALPSRSISRYEVYLSDEYDSLYLLSNLIGVYNVENDYASNHLFTLETPQKGDFLGIKLAGQKSETVALSEIAVYGYQVGDLDGDHQVAATDITVLRRELVREEPYKVHTDINGDGIVNIKDVIRMKKNLIERYHAVNPDVQISEKPENVWVQPETEHPFGAAAPEWMRDAEMYCDATQHQMFTTGGYEKWAKYFDLCIGAWSQDVNTLIDNGVQAGSYFDPYHVYNHEEIAIVDQNGVGIESDYASDWGDPLYLICHNSDKGMDYMRSYVENCLNFGARGMFYDDTRMPYIPLRDKAQTCYSTLHNHVVEGNISSNYINRTVRDLYRLVKERDKNFYVVLNGGTPIPHNQTSEYETENIWKHCDAIMWENFLYDSNCTRWVSADLLKSAGKRLYDGVKQGKTALLLSYSFHNMTAERATSAALDTIAYCRLYDLMWSDYASLYASGVSESMVQRLYNIKTGAAGEMGTYYGRIIDNRDGLPVSGVKVSCGSTVAYSDANGYYRIAMPVNQYDVMLEKDGYVPTIGSVSGTMKDFVMVKMSGTTYYVSPNGNNNNNGKSRTAAFKSLNYAEVSGILKPGDTVIVTEGTYNLPNQTIYEADGTAEAPITYYAEGDVTLRIQKGIGTGLVLTGDYTVFDGFRVEGSVSGVGGLVRAEGRGVEVKNCTFADTAFYTIGSTRQSAAAVELGGEDAFFHHNTFAQGIYSDSALLIGANGARVYNNTFDGKIVTGGTTKTAIALASGEFSVQVKNNIFVDYRSVFTGLDNQNLAANNNLSSAVGNTAGLTDATNKTVSDVQFMYRPYGDYGVKMESAAVGGGEDVGFAYRGEAPDIGAKESKYSRNNYDPVVRTDGVMYRTFTDSVVFMNTASGTRQVTIPLGRASLKLKDVLTDKAYTADANGNLTVTLNAETSLILKAK